MERCLLRQRQACRLHTANSASSQVHHLTVPYTTLLCAPKQDSGSFMLFSQKLLADPSEQDLDTAEISTGEISSQRKCSSQFLFPPKTSIIHVWLQNMICYHWRQDTSLGTAVGFGLHLSSSWQPEWPTSFTSTLTDIRVQLSYWRLTFQEHLPVLSRSLMVLLYRMSHVSKL